MTDQPVTEQRPLVLDELSNQLEQFRILRKGGDESATAALLDQLGAHDPVENEIILELSATRVLGHPERFEEAHALVMRAIEVLDRNGARGPRVPNLGPLKPVAKFGVQLVTRFVVRNHQSDVIDAVRNLYARRLAWCPQGDPSRLPLLRARMDAERVAAGYKGNPIGVPAFLLGGAAASSIVQGFRLLSEAAFGSAGGVLLSLIVVAALLAGTSWCVLRGAALARNRIELTVEEPLAALWQTIGRCGRPPEDDSRTIAVYAIVLSLVGWILIPASILLAFAIF